MKPAKVQIGVRVDAQLWRRVRVVAVQHGVSAEFVVNQALVKELARIERKPK